MNLMKLSSPLILNDRPVDRGVVTGVVISFVLIALGIVAGGNSMNFVSITSFIIVVGGTFGATLVHFSFGDLWQAWKALKAVLFTEPVHPLERIDQLIRLSHTCRRDGILTLEREAQRANDSFLRLAFEITADAQPEADVRRILETDMRTFIERASRSVQVYETLGNYAPALGLIGTLIGLIQMLGSLDNPATVGPAMSLALVTTFYGAILANLLFLPLAGKLRNRSDEELTVKAITVEGVICMAKQENPLVIEQRLHRFIPLPLSEAA